MPIRVSELRMPLEGDERELHTRAARNAGVPSEDIESIELVRKSLDRRRRHPELVYTLDLHIRAGAGPMPESFRDRRVQWADREEHVPPVAGETPLDHPPVVIGCGPAGLFAALVLARAGYRPLVLERGLKMNERVRRIEGFHRGQNLHPEANYLFGEGGAGTFSDGKLTSRSKDPRSRLVLDEFRRRSGNDAVRYFYRPHLGSDRIRAVVGHMRREIESLGGVFRYGTRVDHLKLDLGRLRGLETSAGDIAAEVAITAAGHSARDFYANLLSDGVLLEAKPFQMGFRVEHPQTFVNECLYGTSRPHAALGPADYRLLTKVEGLPVFSFCMCPGGEIIASVHDDKHFSTNGMSYYSKDTGFANSGLVATVETHQFPSNHPLAGVALQEHFEALAQEAAGQGFVLPAQRLPDFLAGRPSADVPKTSCRSGERPADVSKLAPPWLTELVRRALKVFHHQLPGFVTRDAVICGPESRSSSPVRIVRDSETLCGVGADGFYPCGEGAGYAGGIVSAAIDGWRAAEAVISRYAPARITGAFV